MAVAAHPVAVLLVAGMLTLPFVAAMLAMPLVATFLAMPLAATTLTMAVLIVLALSTVVTVTSVVTPLSEVVHLTVVLLGTAGPSVAGHGATASDGIVNLMLLPALMIAVFLRRWRDGIRAP